MKTEILSAENLYKIIGVLFVIGCLSFYWLRVIQEII